MSKYIKCISAFLGGMVTYWLGGFDTLLCLLCAMAVMDYISGVATAAFFGQLSSRVGFMGILKKVCMFIVVACANVLSGYTDLPIREMTIFFYVANEGLSFVENIGKVILLPDWIANLLQSMKEEELD